MFQSNISLIRDMKCNYIIFVNAFLLLRFSISRMHFFNHSFEAMLLDRDTEISL